MRTNILTVYYKEGELNVIGSLYQYDYGQRIVFADLALPTAYEVHFSNEERGESYIMIGDSTGVDIPDELLQTGKNVYVWIYLHTGENDGETVYRYIINVRRRAEPIHDTPTPVQQNEIEQAITALNNAVETTAQDVIDANAAKEAAETAQGKAEEAIAHEPYIDSTTGNWMKWNIALEQYVDTGVHAQGEKGDTGDKGDKGDTGAVPDIQVGNVTTSAIETSVTRQAGSPNERPVFDFAIKKGDKGDRGKDFHIAKTFVSIAAMEAYTGTDLEPYDFAMIDTGSVEDADTGKLFCYMPGINLLDTTTLKATVTGGKKYLYQAKVILNSNNNCSCTINHVNTLGYMTADQLLYFGNAGNIRNEYHWTTTEQGDVRLDFSLQHISIEDATLTEKWGYIGDLSGKQGIKGETGTGIANIVLNNDYTLTITMDDDPDNPTTYTTGSVRGPQGETGAAGYSPSATVSKTGHTATISITDKTGTTTATVMEPTASVSKSGSTSTITITDSTGTTTAQVTDGATGATGATGPTGATPHLTIGTVTDVPYGTGSSATITGTDENPVLNLNLQSGQSGNETIDDTKGIGDTDFVWSADKTDKEVIRLDGIKANNDSVYATKTVSNDVIEIDDAVAEAVKQMRIEIAPVQDLHGYDKPWVGGAGKNLYDSSTDTDAKVINASGVETSSEYSAHSDYIKVSASTAYIFSGTDIHKSGNTTDVATSIVFYNSSKTFISRTDTLAAGNHTFTTDANTAYVIINHGRSASYMQLESGSTATSYEPYSNICPISGWTGAKVNRYSKNLFNKDTALIKKYISTNGVVSNSDNWSASDFIRVSENTTYTLSGVTNSGTAAKHAFYNSSMNFISDVASTTYTFTTPANTAYVRLSLKTETPTSVQLEEGSTATTYDGSAKTYSISFPTSAGTVYGGTLTVNADGTGSLAVNKVGMTIQQLNDLTSNHFGASGGNAFALNIAYFGTMTPAPSATNDVPADGLICSALPTNSRTNILTNNKLGVGINTSKNFIINDETSTTAEQFLTNCGSYFVVYKLENPLTPYTLTTDQVLHLLSGVNNVWSDCGETTITYFTDKYLTAEQADKERIHESITVSAPVQTIEDGADNVPMEMTVGIEPVQNLHGYEYPWVGGAGKNLFNKDSYNSISAYISATPAVVTNAQHTMIYFQCQANTSYTASRKRTSTNERFGIAYTKELPANNVACFDYHAPSTTGTVGDVMSCTTTTGSDAQYVVLWSWWTSSDVTEAKNTLQIEIGSSATTYAPYSNICHISGHTGVEVTRTGKNLMGSDAMKENALANNPTKISWDSTNRYLYWERYTIQDGVILTHPFKENTQYTFIFTMYKNSSIASLARIYYTDGTYSSIPDMSSTGTKCTVVKTSTAGKTVAYIGGMNNYEGTARLYVDESGIFEGALTAQDFEAYTGSTYSITFPSSAGTVYGGTLKVNKDGTGVLTVDKTSVDMGDLDWAWSSSNGYFQIGKDAVSTLTGFNPMRSTLAYYNNSHWKNSGTDNNALYQTTNAYRVVTGLYEGNATTFKTAMAGATIVYEIATPVTYQLSAPIIRSLLGTNNIFCDTGNVLSVNYAADAKRYIDKKLSASQNLMELIITANREDEMKATKAYTTGNLMIVNGTLYKASTSIANGATLTVGTNVTATTVAAEIAALS